MKLRLVFLGSDAIALPMLEAVALETDVVAVYTQPDRPVGRGQRIQANDIKTWALARNIPVFQPEKLSEDTRLELAALKADLGLVMAYGHILKDAFIATPRLGMVNLHASLLPSYRGASPIQTAVACGESEIGVSLMRIVRELDAGPVADLERIPVLPGETALEAEAKLAQACVPLMQRNLAALASGDLVFVEQDRSRATFCRKLSKEDAVLDFSLPAILVAARINGLFPWPASAVEILGQSVKLGQAEMAEAASSGKAPGTVLGVDSRGLLVSCGQGVLRLLKLQRPGGKLLPASEFLRGFPIPEGQVLPSTSLAPMVAPQPFPRRKP